jgi:drug/metabolite transporter (DMT)-like permease
MDQSVVAGTKPRSWSQSGEMWALIGVLGYASSNVFEGYAVKGADPLIGPLIRGIPTVALALFLMATRKTYRQLQPNSANFAGWHTIMLFVIPGVISTLGLFTYFQALRYGGVVITIPVQQSFIIWGAATSWIFLKERFSHKSLSGIALLVGGLVLLGMGQIQGTPVTGQWYYAIPLALFTAIVYGVSGVFWRLGQLRGADQSTGIFVNIIASEIIALLGLWIAGRTGALFETSAEQLGALLAGGVLSGIVGLYGIFTSLKLMSVTRAYALNSLTPLTAAILAFIFLREDINLQMLAGVLIVCLGVALVQIYKPTEEMKATHEESHSQQNLP